MFRANYPVKTHLTTGKYPYIPCLLGNLGSFSGRDIKASSKQRGAFICWGVASYLNPASLLNITHEIVDRLFNT
jgi:hypothetical protein